MWKELGSYYFYPKDKKRLDELKTMTFLELLRELRLQGELPL